jgi:hypothetical protein
MILPPEFIGQPANPDRTRWIPQGTIQFEQAPSEVHSTCSGFILVR